MKLLLPLLGLTLDVVAPQNREDDGAPLRVEAPSCPTLDAHEVERLVSLELEAVTQEVRAGPPLRVELECEGEQLRIAVTDPVTDKRLQRQVPAPTEELGKERVVALAIAQLFAASWLELLLVQDPDEAAVEVEPRPAPGTSAGAVEAARRVAHESTAVLEPEIELMAGAGVRGRALEAAPFPALVVDVEVRGWLAEGVAVVGRVGYDHGQAERELGRVIGQAVTVGAGLGWRWRPRSSIGLGGSALICAGWARVTGRTDRQGPTTGSNQGATGDLTVGLGPRVFAGRFRLDLDAELGGMLRSPEGLVSRERSVSMGGLYAGAVLRLGTDLSRKRR